MMKNWLFAEVGLGPRAMPTTPRVNGALENSAGAAPTAPAVGGRSRGGGLAGCSDGLPDEPTVALNLGSPPRLPLAEAMAHAVGVAAPVIRARRRKRGARAVRQLWRRTRYREVRCP